MSKKMLVNVLEPEECRIAIVENGSLEELYVERSSSQQLVGNIYKARVVNVEPSLGAAFVDFGWSRNGFLHGRDVLPTYFSDERLARRVREGKAPENFPISGALKRGQDLMVQVSKEGIDRKAPKVTTYVSIPGRYLVLMPDVKRRGVSRKIEDEEERKNLREMLDSLKPPKEMGFIIRTAGAKQTLRELRKDLTYLTRLWAAIQKRYNEAPSPGLLYQESDLVIRAVRDIYTNDIEEMLVDSENEYNKVLEFMKVTMPRQRKFVAFYQEDEPLFHKSGVEEQIEKIHQRRVQLPGGGSIVIDQTEALVAIDVNSGKNTRESNVELTATKTNLEAAKEIARQLRLRDMGGVIVVDFIDMIKEDNRHEVEKALWEAMRGDRARIKMLRMSKFGVVEMTRQRMRPSLRSATYERCSMCDGSGYVKSLQSMGLEILRTLRATVKKKGLGEAQLAVNPQVAGFLLNKKRRDLLRLEEESQARITVLADSSLGIEARQVTCYAEDGSKMKS